VSSAFKTILGGKYIRLIRYVRLNEMLSKLGTPQKLRNKKLLRLRKTPLQMAFDCIKNHASKAMNLKPHKIFKFKGIPSFSN